MWINDEEHIKLKKFYENRERGMWITMFDPKAKKVFRERFERNEDNRKMAWITQGKTRKMAWVDNKTMDAYKMKEMYGKTWMKIKQFTFERWCTSFDV